MSENNTTLNTHDEDIRMQDAETLSGRPSNAVPLYESNNTGNSAVSTSGGQPLVGDNLTPPWSESIPNRIQNVRVKMQRTLFELEETDEKLESFNKQCRLFTNSSQEVKDKANERISILKVTIEQLKELAKDQQAFVDRQEKLLASLRVLDQDNQPTRVATGPVPVQTRTTPALFMPPNGLDSDFHGHRPAV